MRRVLAAVLVMSAACGSTGGNTPTTEPAPTTTLPATTTTTVSEQARCALFVDGLTDPLTTTVQSLLEFERLATEATTTVDLNPIADDMNVLAATMRRVERQLLDMDPPPQLIDTHELVIEAVTKLHTGFDMAASGARQKRTDLVNAATAEIQAGTALVVAARQSVPEGGC